MKYTQIDRLNFENTKNTPIGIMISPSEITTIDKRKIRNC